MPLQLGKAFKPTGSSGIAFDPSGRHGDFSGLYCSDSPLKFCCHLCRPKADDLDEGVSTPPVPLESPSKESPMPSGDEDNSKHKSSDSRTSSPAEQSGPLEGKADVASAENGHMDNAYSEDDFEEEEAANAQSPAEASKTDKDSERSGPPSPTSYSSDSSTSGSEEEGEDNSFYSDAQSSASSVSLPGDTDDELMDKSSAGKGSEEENESDEEGRNVSAENLFSSGRFDNDSPRSKSPASVASSLLAEKQRPEGEEEVDGDNQPQPSGDTGQGANMLPSTSSATADGPAKASAQDGETKAANSEPEADEHSPSHSTSSLHSQPQRSKEHTLQGEDSESQHGSESLHSSTKAELQNSPEEAVLPSPAKDQQETSYKESGISEGQEGADRGSGRNSPTEDVVEKATKKNIVEAPSTLEEEGKNSTVNASEEKTPPETTGHEQHRQEEEYASAEDGKTSEEAKGRKEEEETTAVHDISVTSSQQAKQVGQETAEALTDQKEGRKD